MASFGRGILGAGLALAYSCGAVSAATVSGPTGSVLVNKGGGFAAITSSTDVAPGAQIMVKADAVAVISYGEGCSVRIAPGRVWTVQEGIPCAAGAQEIDFTTRMNHSGSLKDDPGSSGIPRDHYLIGGAVVGGLVIACLVDWCKDKSASP